MKNDKYDLFISALAYAIQTGNVLYDDAIDNIESEFSEISDHLIDLLDVKLYVASWAYSIKKGVGHYEDAIEDIKNHCSDNSNIVIKMLDKQLKDDTFIMD